MEAIKNIHSEKILFLDIETAPQYPSYDKIPESFQKLWDLKSKRLITDTKSPSDVYKSAGIYAEFGKVVSICLLYTSPSPRD